MSYRIPDFGITLSVNRWRDELELRLAAHVKESTLGSNNGLELLPWKVHCAPEPHIENKMWEQLLGTLPSQQEPKSMTDTLAGIQRLQDSPLHTYLSAGMMAQVGACKKMVQELSKGSCPSGIDGASGKMADFIKGSDY